jgi:hypothetical protein
LSDNQFLAVANTASAIRVVRFTETLFLGFEIEERTFTDDFDVDWGWCIVARFKHLEDAEYSKNYDNRPERISVRGVEFNHLLWTEIFL